MSAPTAARSSWSFSTLSMKPLSRPTFMPPGRLRLGPCGSASGSWLWSVPTAPSAAGTVLGGGGGLMVTLLSPKMMVAEPPSLVTAPRKSLMARCTRRSRKAGISRSSSGTGVLPDDPDHGIAAAEILAALAAVLDQAERLQLAEARAHRQHRLSQLGGAFVGGEAGAAPVAHQGKDAIAQQRRGGGHRARRLGTRLGPLAARRRRVARAQAGRGSHATSRAAPAARVAWRKCRSISPSLKPWRSRSARVTLPFIDISWRT